MNIIIPASGNLLTIAMQEAFCLKTKVSIYIILCFLRVYWTACLMQMFSVELGQQLSNLGCIRVTWGDYKPGNTQGPIPDPLSQDLRGWRQGTWCLIGFPGDSDT